MLITSVCSCNQHVCLHHCCCCSLPFVVDLRSKTIAVSAVQNDIYNFSFRYVLQNDIRLKFLVYVSLVVAPSVDSCKFVCTIAVPCTWLLTYVPRPLRFLHTFQDHCSFCTPEWWCGFSFWYLSLSCMWHHLLPKSHMDFSCDHACVECVPTMDILFSGIWLVVPTREAVWWFVWLVALKTGFPSATYACGSGRLVWKQSWWWPNCMIPHPQN